MQIDTFVFVGSAIAKESLAFISYVRSRFPIFEGVMLLRLSVTYEVYGQPVIYESYWE